MSTERFKKNHIQADDLVQDVPLINIHSESTFGHLKHNDIGYKFSNNLNRVYMKVNHPLEWLVDQPNRQEIVQKAHSEKKMNKQNSKSLFDSLIENQISRFYNLPDSDEETDTESESMSMSSRCSSMTSLDSRMSVV